MQVLAQSFALLPRLHSLFCLSSVSPFNLLYHLCMCFNNHFNFNFHGDFSYMLQWWNSTPPPLPPFSLFHPFHNLKTKHSKLEVFRSEVNTLLNQKLVVIFTAFQCFNGKDTRNFKIVQHLALETVEDLKLPQKMMSIYARLHDNWEVQNCRAPKRVLIRRSRTFKKNVVSIFRMHQLDSLGSYQPLND